jgi:hypothetical protein
MAFSLTTIWRERLSPLGVEVVQGLVTHHDPHAKPAPSGEATRVDKGPLHPNDLRRIREVRDTNVRQKHVFLPFV